LTINSTESEGTKLFRISTATWDNGFPTDFQRRSKKTNSIKLDHNAEPIVRIKKLETMHAISQIQDRRRYYEEEDNEDFPKEEDEEYEETPRGPTIEISRSETIPTSFTAYEILLERDPSKQGNIPN